jgi:hypothetical protein
MPSLHTSTAAFRAAAGYFAIFFDAAAEADYFRGFFAIILMPSLIYLPIADFLRWQKEFSPRDFFELSIFYFFMSLKPLLILFLQHLVLASSSSPPLLLSLLRHASFRY